MSGDQELAALDFAPKPENDFAQYISRYYEDSRSRFPGIEAVAGKWMFRDLVPGMSDFDTRFIVRDGMTTEDWCRMSTAVGEVHLALCQKYRCWIRNLEHLPGVNLTWSELTSEETYYPEFHQWSFYNFENPGKVSAALAWLANRPWDDKDEYFHLKKFCNYFGRYNRTIDPPINLGVHENKYPLHSRVMHYFTPAVQAAVSLLERQSIAGKFDALEIARRHFPDLSCWGVINEILHANYELHRWYREPLLSDLEERLETALQVIALKLRTSIRLVPDKVGADVNAWKKYLQGMPVDPTVIILDSARFSRLMKGRLRFYAQAPPHFDSSWLIGHELRRIGRDFFQTPFTIFWKIRTGESITDATGVLDRLRGDLLTSTQAAAAKEFSRLTATPCESGREKQVAMAVADVFDDFFKALAKIRDAVSEMETSDAAT